MDNRTKARISVMIRNSWRRKIKIINWIFINERIITLDIKLVS